MVSHEREECEWAVVECSYQCGAHLPRRLMAEHQRDVCPQRSVDARLERMEERHKREMFALKSEMAEELTTVREKMQIMKVCSREFKFRTIRSSLSVKPYMRMVI